MGPVLSVRLSSSIRESAFFPSAFGGLCWEIRPVEPCCGRLNGRLDRLHHHAMLHETGMVWFRRSAHRVPHSHYVTVQYILLPYVRGVSLSREIFSQKPFV